MNTTPHPLTPEFVQQSIGSGLHAIGVNRDPKTHATILATIGATITQNINKDAWKEILEHVIETAGKKKTPQAILAMEVFLAVDRWLQWEEENQKTEPTKEEPSPKLWIPNK